MRNISFSESSVLQEFAKIAAKKGLIKVAAGPAAQELERLDAYRAKLMSGGKELKDILPQFKPYLENAIRAFKTKYRMANPQQLAQFEAQARTLLEPIKAPIADTSNELVPRASIENGAIKEAAHITGAQYLNDLSAEVKKLGGHQAFMFAGMIESYAKQNPSMPLKEAMLWANDTIKRGTEKFEDKGLYLNALYASDSRFNRYLLGQEPVQASTKTDLSKEGAEKLYDVSGQTGEGLVEEAHPETAKIEKTDQVVENLVEQQEADLKVVEKKPTGKYAELITLADHLDSVGLYSYADRIDALIKKAAEPLQDIGWLGPQGMPGTFVPSTAKPGEEVGYQSTPFFTTQTITPSVPVQPSQKVEERGKYLKYPRSEEIRAFQAEFNSYLPASGLSIKPLVVDGTLGPKTMAAVRMMGAKNVAQARRNIALEYRKKSLQPTQPQQEPAKIDLVKQDAVEVSKTMLGDVVKMMGLKSYKDLSTKAIEDINKSVAKIAWDVSEDLKQKGTEFANAEARRAAIRQLVLRDLTPEVLNEWKAM